MARAEPQALRQRLSDTSPGRFFFDRAARACYTDLRRSTCLGGRLAELAGKSVLLAAAGALTIFDTARLLRMRGQAMQRAVPVGAGAMAALLGLEFDVARAVAEEAAQGQVCEPANDNGGGQVVVSGDKAAVERAVELAKAAGAKRAMLLPVSAPFHCALMAPAAEAMAEALAAVKIKWRRVKPRSRERTEACRSSRMLWCAGISVLPPSS